MELKEKDPTTADNPKTMSVLKDWRVFSLADAYQERPMVQYLVGNLFELPSLNVVYGAPGTLKSFLLADLACCVVGGEDWLKPVPGATEKGMTVSKNPIVWIDFDNGKRRTHDRFAALGRAYDLPVDAPLYYYSMSSPRLDASSQTHMNDLAQLIREHGAKLVVIDNLGTISGGADENSADMIEVLAQLRRLAESLVTAVVVIHHSRKSNGSNGRKGDALRGHSSIEAALDLALLVERESGSKTIQIQATKAHGADVTPFSAMFTFEDDTKGQLHKARFFLNSDENFVVIANIMKAISACLGEETLNKTALVADVHETMGKKVGISRIRSTIDFMREQKYLLEKPGANNAQLYSRNPEKPYGGSTVSQA